MQIKETEVFRAKMECSARGPLPMDVLERRARAWIEHAKNGQAAAAAH